jgi:hypothetical protein
LVVSVIALFAALGGGYATAFSGSGTLQKAKVTGLPDAAGTFTTVRTLTGIGSIQASCTGGAVTVRFHNGSGAELISDLDDGAEDPVTLDLLNGENHDAAAVAGDDDLFRYHIYPVAPDDKQPQADVSVAAFENGTCSAAEVTVLALNTEE